MSLWKSIYTILTLSCDQASSLISKSQEIPLAGSERIALRVHHGLCQSCRRYSRQLQALRELFKAAAAKSRIGDLRPAKVHPEQKKRVLDFLRKHLS
ncbi:MAG: hypothetical protein HQ515_19605 [Phycisphaeraceae bacterium]|nr:hypothetical protein [Phycisphaeraceae bacterium]